MYSCVCFVVIPQAATVLLLCLLHHSPYPSQMQCWVSSTVRQCWRDPELKFKPHVSTKCLSTKVWPFRWKRERERKTSEKERMEFGGGDKLSMLMQTRWMYIRLTSPQLMLSVSVEGRTAQHYNTSARAHASSPLPFFPLSLYSLLLQTLSPVIPLSLAELEANSDLTAATAQKQTQRERTELTSGYQWIKMMFTLFHTIPPLLIYL